LLSTPELVSARTLRPEGKDVTVVLENGRVQQMLVCLERFVIFRKREVGTIGKIEKIWYGHVYNSPPYRITL
jgi:hypothetical protein